MPIATTHVQLYTMSSTPVCKAGYLYHRSCLSLLSTNSSPLSPLSPISILSTLSPLSPLAPLFPPSSPCPLTLSPFSPLHIPLPFLNSFSFQSPPHFPYGPYPLPSFLYNTNSHSLVAPCVPPFRLLLLVL